MAAGTVAAQEHEPDLEQAEYAQAESVATDSSGSGLVLELDHGDGAGPDDSADMQPREMADSDVELILGGAARDGMAKRTRLKKED